MKISHLKFVILYTLYSFFVFNIPLFKDFTKTLNPKTFGDFSFMFFVTIAALMLTFTFFSLFLQGITLKFFAILFLMLHTGIFYFISSYNIQIDRTMIMNVLHTDIQETKDLLSVKLFLYLFFFGLLPSVFVFVAKIKRNAKKTLLSALVSLILAPFVLSIVYVKVAPFFRVNRYFGESLVPFNYAVHGGILVKRYFFPKNAFPEIKIEDLEIGLKEELNIVLVVGETARRQNFGIYGYHRNTTPMLEKIPNLVKLKGISCGTSTAVSVPCIFEFKENYESYLRSISKAGVFVKWYENNFGGCYGTCRDVPTFKTEHSKCDGSCPDGVIFEEFYKDFEVQKNLKKPKFFILHQNGSHGPLYYRRYPAEFSKFTPECKTASVNECSLENLINSYDNTILYTDFLLANTIEMLKKSKRPSVLIYVSDHGESLGEKGIFLHGFPYSIAPKEQKEIPFLVWSSFPLKINEKDTHFHKEVMQGILFLLKAKTSHSNQNELIFAK